MPSLLQPVVTPGQYFQRRTPRLPVRPAVGAALSMLASGVAMWAIVEQILAGATFEVGGEMVAARSAAVDAARRQLGFLIPGRFFGWGLLVVAVHAGSLLDASAGDLTDSAAVASWGFVVVSLEGVVRGTALAVLLRTRGQARTVAGLERQVSGAVAGLGGVPTLALSVATAGWLGYVLYQGLRHGRGMDQDGAGLVAGSVALVVVALSL